MRRGLITSHHMEDSDEKLLTFAVSLMTGATMLLAAAPALAGTNVVMQIPGPAPYMAAHTVPAQPVPLYSVRHHVPNRGPL
jgi:hypothetical protein